MARSNFPSNSIPRARGPPLVFLIDSTGELRDWTAHADVVIIGKSFLARGGQNPSEAILANKPVIFGPHMENFEPLAGRLDATRGHLALMQAAFARAIITALDPLEAGSADPQRGAACWLAMRARRNGFSPCLSASHPA